MYSVLTHECRTAVQLCSAVPLLLLGVLLSRSALLERGLNLGDLVCSSEVTGGLLLESAVEEVMRVL